MTQIIGIQALQILDSRGFPTIEVEVHCDSGAIGRAAVPSGASTGTHEAHELRDGGKNYGGKAVQNAVDNCNGAIQDLLMGIDATNQAQIDSLLCELDGTDNKKRMGANAILGVSLACAKAAAITTGQSLYKYVGGVSANYLPVPMMNIINGGKHADNPIDIQEFMIMPIDFRSFSSALQGGVEIFQQLKKLIKDKGYNSNVGDEGGFAPNFSSAEQALDSICQAIKSAGFTAGKEVFIALDCASSEYHSKGIYDMKGEGKKFDAKAHGEYLSDLAKKYPIYSIEDGMAEDDHQGWTILTKLLGKKLQIVGDDLFVTNPKILRQGIKDGLANALLVKPNQIGTLSETIQAVQIAQKSGYNCIMSHRSGETEDATIADLAVALRCGQIKTGAPCRSDRTAKYNQLLRIERELGAYAQYAGTEILKC